MNTGLGDFDEFDATNRNFPDILDSALNPVRPPIDSVFRPLARGMGLKKLFDRVSLFRTRTP